MTTGNLTVPRTALFCAHADVNGDVSRCPCATRSAVQSSPSFVSGIVPSVPPGMTVDDDWQTAPVNRETAALSALRDCRLNLLRASVAAAHTQAVLSGAVRARELVGKIDDAITLVGQLLAEVAGK